MRFLITGGTGLIGKQIVRLLEKRGDEVHVLSRGKKYFKNSNKVKFFHWDPEFGSIDLNSLLEDKKTDIGNEIDIKFFKIGLVFYIL